MNDFTWNTFKENIRAYFQVLFSDAEYTGKYENISETSAIFFGIARVGENTLENQLRMLAREFSQDSIGLSVNRRQSSLVYGDEAA